ncbi:MAG: isochorismatase family cysteine hydrolase, partial [Candidatus Hydrothermarchaeaceae archaeon]
MKALLVIDMLNDFVNEDGALPVPDARTLVPSINREIKKCREEASPIIFVCDAHDKDDREFLTWPKHAVDGTEGAKIIDELDRRDSDMIVKKKRYSAFYDTSLETILEEKGVSTMVLTGVLTDICVMHTASDASMRNYRVIVPEDCVKSVSKEAHDWAIKHMKDILLEVEVR